MPCQDQGLFLDHFANHTQQEQPSLTAPAVAKQGEGGRSNFQAKALGGELWLSLFRWSSSTEQHLRYSSKVGKVTLEFNASAGEITSSWKIDGAVKSCMLSTRNKEIFRCAMRWKVSALTILCPRACKDVSSDKLILFRKERVSSPC